MRRQLINRSETIKRLVACSVKTAIQESPTYWLNKVFEDGFVGYSRLSDTQLMMEMEMRGLIQSEDDCDDENQEADEFYATDLNLN